MISLGKIVRDNIGKECYIIVLIFIFTPFISGKNHAFYFMKNDNMCPKSIY